MGQNCKQTRCHNTIVHKLCKLSTEQYLKATQIWCWINCVPKSDPHSNCNILPTFQYFVSFAVETLSVKSGTQYWLLCVCSFPLHSSYLCSQITWEYINISIEDITRLVRKLCTHLVANTIWILCTSCTRFHWNGFITIVSAADVLCCQTELTGWADGQLGD